MNCWEKYGGQIVDIERVLYSSPLRESEDELRTICENPNAVFVLILDNDIVVGYICGEDVREYVWSGDEEYDAHLEEAGTLYVETFNVRPEFQGRGYGKMLLKTFIEEANKKAFKFISGHFSDNGPSIHIAKKLGAKIRCTDVDYAGTGKTFHYAVIDIGDNYQ